MIRTWIVLKEGGPAAILNTTREGYRRILSSGKLQDGTPICAIQVGLRDGKVLLHDFILQRLGYPPRRVSPIRPLPPILRRLEGRHNLIVIDDAL
jgi:hypothetical protein